MLRWGMMIWLLILGSVSAGCRPAINVLKGTPKAVSKTPKKLPFMPIPPAASKTATPLLRNEATLLARAVAIRTPQIVAASKTLGARLMALQTKIPPGVYAQLWRQWQRNDAELNSFAHQLAEPGVPADRRQRIETQIELLEQQNVEIEQLVAQWG